MISFVAGALKDTALSAIFPYFTKLRDVRRQRYVKNILAKLNTEYVPDVIPKFGPVFERDNWKEGFLRKACSDMYLCYYGASDSGKSVAICNSLKGRKGVIYLPLRKATPDTISHIFATQIGYFGAEKINKDVPFTEFQDAFQEACSQFIIQNNGAKVILFADDVESQFKESTKDIFYPYTAELPLYWVDLYNQGLMNCVFSVSDYRAISVLKSLTAHSTRFRCEQFPTINDEKLKKYLSELTYEIQANQDNPYYWTWHFREKAKETAKKEEESTEKKRVLDHDGEAEKLVDSLGSQMGSLIATLRLVLFDKKSVDDAIHSLVLEEIPVVTSALDGELYDVADAQINQSLFICVTWKAFERLSQTNENNIKWASLKEDFPTTRTTDIKRVINRLVSLNLLYYSSSGENIGFHRKVLKRTYLHLKDHAPYLLQEEMDAMKELSKKNKE